MPSETTIQNFRATLQGQSFRPGEPGYDEVRTVPNAMIDRRPAIIARCISAADVIACVHFARNEGVTLSVRGGGHSVAGKSVIDDGLMIDLSAMKSIRVDPRRRTARAEPGLTLGEFDRNTQAFGLATTLGVVPKVGIAGLTLGGGFGHLMAKHGLALDNLISVDVVTADGRLLTAHAEENTDLFWGVRGSSGNLGIVTSLKYRLHEVGPVLGGVVMHPVARASEVLRFCRDYARTLPDEAVIQGGALTGPDGTKLFAVAAFYCGPSLAEGEKVLDPLRKFGPPVADMISRMSYLEIQRFFEPFFPPGRHTYTKSNFLRELDDEAIDTMAQWAGKSPSPTTFAPFFEHWHGAVCRVGVSDTVFPHRNHSWNVFAWSTWTDAADTEKNLRWTREFWAAMRPHLTGGSYVNYVSDEGEASARASYGPNYERLLALKSKYDPTNLFRMNHNVPPLTAASAPRTA
ncbi:MAG TPA: FAD-binding oxidoreductase [Steroidobacteraceae bacterium]|nr:FAD-binding oxidoreductase [Steroidobacteraceae bacterium]